MSPPPRGGEERPDGGWGGAADYAKFLQTELLPYIAGRYRTLPFTIIAGHSLTGLFAVYAYASHPEFVNAAIAISPTLIWSDTTVRDMSDAVRLRNKNGRLFVAAGVSEVDLDSAAVRLATNLGERPNPFTVFQHRRLAEDSHFTSRLQAMIDGLRFIFHPVQLSNFRAGMTLQERDSRADSVGRAILARYQETRRRYIEGARELGLPERLPAPFSGGLSIQLAANAGQASTAKVICEDILAMHPESWIGYDCMGVAKRFLNDLVGSAEAYRTGIAIAERTGDARAVERMKRALQDVQSRSP
jgi:pimeloyl-ACP methyl ester carboxylesterase